MLIALSVAVTLFWIPIAWGRSTLLQQTQTQLQPPPRQPTPTILHQSTTTTTSTSQHHPPPPSPVDTVRTALHALWSEKHNRTFLPVHHRIPGGTPQQVFVHPELAGGLNNQRICLINAITLAIIKNLTVLVPTALSPFTKAKEEGQISQPSVPLSAFFDVDRLVAEGVVRMVAGLPGGVQKKKVRVGKVTSWVDAAVALRKIDAELAPDGSGNTPFNYVKMKCQFALGWGDTTTTTTSTPTTISTHLQSVALYVLRNVRFSPSIVHPALSFIKTMQKERQTYNVVHLRAEADWVVLRASGLAKVLGDKRYKALNIVEEEMHEAFRAVRRVEAKTPPQPGVRSVWVVAGGVACSDAAMVKAAATILQNVDLYCVGGKGMDIPIRIGERGDGNNVASSATHSMKAGSMSYVKAGVDQVVATHAKVFIGRKESSLSAFVAYERRNGKHFGLPHGLLRPSFLYMPPYERSFKPKIDNSDIDVRCFGYPCTLPGIANTNASLSTWLQSEQTTKWPEGSIFETCLQKGNNVRAGVLDTEDTLGGGCGLTPLFTVFDARLLWPRSVVHIVSNTLTAILTKRRGMTPVEWLHRWLPAYIWGENVRVEEVGTAEDGLAILYTTWSDLDNTAHKNLVNNALEVYILCNTVEAECAQWITTQREAGQYAHRLWEVAS